RSSLVRVLSAARAQRDARDGAAALAAGPALRQFHGARLAHRTDAQHPEGAPQDAQAECDLAARPPEPPHLAGRERCEMLPARARPRFRPRGCHLARLRLVYRDEAGERRDEVVRHAEDADLVAQKFALGPGTALEAQAVVQRLDALASPEDMQPRALGDARVHPAFPARVAEPAGDGDAGRTTGEAGAHDERLASMELVGRR